MIATGRDTSCTASEIHRSNNGYLSLATTIDHTGLVTAVGLTGVRRVNETRSSNSHCDFADVISFTNRRLLTSSPISPLVKFLVQPGLAMLKVFVKCVVLNFLDLYYLDITLKKLSKQGAFLYNSVSNP